MAWALCLILVAMASPIRVQAATVVAGDNHSLLLRDDGTLWAWGENGSGQLGDGTTISRPAPVHVMSGVKAIAAGSLHSLAVKTDGTLWAWGNNKGGQLGDGTADNRVAPLQVLSGVAAVGAKTLQSMAVKTDGTLWLWGDSTGGAASQLRGGFPYDLPKPVLSGVRAAAPGSFHWLALKTDGTVWAALTNRSGQLGDGTTEGRDAPVQVMSGVQGIAAGEEFSLALKTDGTLWAWGDNALGQLGDGSTVGRATPLQVMSAVRAFAAGTNFSMAVKTDGSLWAWGDNLAGQLGDGTFADRATPVQITTGVQSVSGGSAHALGIKTDGTLLSWGDNIFGQLGDGTAIDRATPVQALSGVQSVGAGFYFSMALKTDGTLWAWGDNRYFQLGPGSSEYTSATPTQILSGVKAMSGGGFHGLALKNDNTLWAWGANFFSQVGNDSEEDVEIPVQVLTGVQGAAAGFEHSMALKTDGTLWVWGDNAFGQLGIDSTDFGRRLPEQMMSEVRAIAAGYDHSLALKTDGTLWAWGATGIGRSGLGTVGSGSRVPVQVMSGVQAIAAGGQFSLALKTDGTLWAWGLNDVGQLGDGTTVNRETPVQVMSGVRDIAAGGRLSLATRADNSLWSWGAIANQLSIAGVRNVPQQNQLLRSATRVTAGFRHALVLTADGRSLAWGSNAFQQLAVAHPSERVRPGPVRDPLAAYAGADLVVEFFNPTIRNGAGNAGIGHYFITAAAAEAASIDAGGSGPGWARTQRTFRAWNDPAKAPAGAVGVCRFYARVPNSHFYTASAGECQSLKTQNPTNDPNLGWSYEGIAFYTVIPQGSGCPAGYQPVYRSYNNRFNPNPALNDGNHRITPSYGDYQRSIRFFAYADEGIAFCSPVDSNPGGDLQVTYAYPGATVQAGSAITAEFVFGNNGAGRGDGGSVHIALPAAVSNWTVTCASRNGAVCPPTGDLSRLREGAVIPTWPAGGTLTFAATGTAPPVTAGSDPTLNFAAIAGNASGSPDSTPANDAPPIAQTIVKAAAVCNTSVNPAVLQLGPAAQTPRVNLIAGNGCPWSAQASAPWILVTPPNGNGDTTISVALAANPSSSERTGTVTVNGKTIAITQSGVACVFTAAPPTLNFTTAAQSAVVAITATAADCEWSAQAQADWLDVTPAAGNGSRSITITAQGNTATVSRNSSIVLAGVTIPVTQSGVVQVATPGPRPPDPCASLRLQREGDQIAPGGMTGAVAFDVIAESQCIWEAKSNAPWLTLVAGSGANGGRTVKYLVEPNGDAQPRTGTITIMARTFTVNQFGNVDSGAGGDGGGDGGSSGGGGSGGSSG